MLKINDVLKFRTECGIEVFAGAFEKVIMTIYNIALNQGFDVMDL